MHALVTNIRPNTLTFHIPIQSSSTASATGARPKAPPALLTSTSMRRKRLPISATKRFTLSRSVTSSSRARPDSPTALRMRSTRRAPPTTTYPWPASAEAVAAPIPDEASRLYAMQTGLRRLKTVELEDRNAHERLRILSTDLRKAVQDRFEQLELLPFGRL